MVLSSSLSGIASCSAYSTCSGRPGAICSLPKLRRTFRVDFVLVREEVRGVGAGTDWRNVLYGLMFAGVPSVNNLQSIVMFGERPIVYGRLLQIRQALGVRSHVCRRLDRRVACQHMIERGLRFARSCAHSSALWRSSIDD